MKAIKQLAFGALSCTHAMQSRAKALLSSSLCALFALAFGSAWAETVIVTDLSQNKPASTTGGVSYTAPTGDSSIGSFAGNGVAVNTNQNGTARSIISTTFNVDFDLGKNIAANTWKQLVIYRTGTDSKSGAPSVLMTNEGKLKYGWETGATNTSPWNDSNNTEITISDDKKYTFNGGNYALLTFCSCGYGESSFGSAIYSEQGDKIKSIDGLKGATAFTSVAVDTTYVKAVATQPGRITTDQIKVNSEALRLAWVWAGQLGEGDDSVEWTDDGSLWKNPLAASEPKCAYREGESVEFAGEGGTVTINSAKTVKTLKVTSGTWMFTGLENVTASKIYIAEGAMLRLADNCTIPSSTTISGAGTLDLGASGSIAAPSTQLQQWTGAVRFTGRSVEGVVLGNYGNVNSFIELCNVTRTSKIDFDGNLRYVGEAGADYTISVNVVANSICFNGGNYTISSAATISGKNTSPTLTVCGNASVKIENSTFYFSSFSGGVTIEDGSTLYLSNRKQNITASNIKGGGTLKVTSTTNETEGHAVYLSLTGSSFNGDVEVTGYRLGVSTFNLGNASLVLAGDVWMYSGSEKTLDGNIMIKSGTVKLDTSAKLTFSGTVTVESGATFNINRATAFTGTFVNKGGTVNVTANTTFTTFNANGATTLTVSDSAYTIAIGTLNVAENVTAKVQVNGGKNQTTNISNNPNQDKITLTNVTLNSGSTLEQSVAGVPKAKLCIGTLTLLGNATLKGKEGNYGTAWKIDNLVSGDGVTPVLTLDSGHKANNNAVFEFAGNGTVGRFFGTIDVKQSATGRSRHTGVQISNSTILENATINFSEASSDDAGNGPTILSVAVNVEQAKIAGLSNLLANGNQLTLQDYQQLKVFSGTLDLACANDIWTKVRTLSDTTNTLVVAVSPESASKTFSGSFEGVNIEMSGAGTQIVTGAYTGNSVNVTAGTLELQGTSTINEALNVAEGATFKASSNCSLTLTEGTHDLLGTYSITGSTTVKPRAIVNATLKEEGAGFNLGTLTTEVGSRVNVTSSHNRSEIDISGVDGEIAFNAMTDTTPEYILSTGQTKTLHTAISGTIYVNDGAILQTYGAIDFEDVTIDSEEGVSPGTFRIHTSTDPSDVASTANIYGRSRILTTVTVEYGSTLILNDIVDLTDTIQNYGTVNFAQNVVIDLGGYSDQDDGDLNHRVYALVENKESTQNDSPDLGTIEGFNRLTKQSFQFQGDLLSDRKQLFAISTADTETDFDTAAVDGTFSWKGSVSVTGKVGDLVWNGNASDTWTDNDSTATVWTKAGTATADYFRNADNVTFNTQDATIALGTDVSAKNMIVRESLTLNLAGHKFNAYTIAVAEGKTLTINNSTDTMSELVNEITVTNTVITVDGVEKPIGGGTVIICPNGESGVNIQNNTTMLDVAGGETVDLGSTLTNPGMSFAKIKGEGTIKMKVGTSNDPKPIDVVWSGFTGTVHLEGITYAGTTLDPDSGSVGILYCDGLSRDVFGESATLVLDKSIAILGDVDSAIFAKVEIANSANIFLGAGDSATHTYNNIAIGAGARVTTLSGTVTFDSYLMNNGTLTTAGGTCNIADTVSGSVGNIAQTGGTMNFAATNNGTFDMTGGALAFSGTNSGTLNITNGDVTFTGTNAHEINVTGGAVTFSGANSGTLNVTTGAMTFSGTNTGTLNIAEDAVVTATVLFAGNLSGQGTLAMDSTGRIFTANSIKPTLTQWFGTFKLSGKIGAYQENIVNSTYYRNGNDSIILLSGAYGYFSTWSGTESANIQLEDVLDGNGNISAYAFKDTTVTTSGNTTSTYNRVISGSGTFYRSCGASNATSGTNDQNYRFTGDLSNFTGTFKSENPLYTGKHGTLTFGDAPTSIEEGAEPIQLGAFKIDWNNTTSGADNKVYFNYGVANAEYAGVFVSGNIVKQGNGNLKLNAASTDFAGSMVVNAGTLEIGNVNALGNATVTVAIGATLNSTVTASAGEKIVSGTSFTINGTVLHNGNEVAYEIRNDGLYLPKVVDENTVIVVGTDTYVPGTLPENLTIKTPGAGDTSYNITEWVTASRNDDGKVVISLDPTKTTDLVPSITEMAMPNDGGSDKIRFSISNAKAGLYYAVVESDNPAADANAWTPVGGSDTQATENGNKADIEITMPTNVSVKFYKVRTQLKANPTTL